MIKNDIPREEFEELVKKAYQEAVMDKEAQEKIRMNLLNYREYSGKNKYYKVFAAAVAAVLIFFVCNGLLIGLNLRHSRQMENKETKMSQGNVTGTETDFVERNKVVYKFDVYPEHDEENTAGQSQNSGLTVKVVLTEEYIGDSSKKKDNQVTGNFVLRITDAAGKVLGETPLSTSVSSEHGLTLNTDKKSMDKYFRSSYEGTIVFSMPVQTVKKQKLYLSSFYGVTKNGRIFLYKPDSEIPDSICGESGFDLITGETRLSPVISRAGYWTDCHWLNEDGKACLAVYYLNADSGCIEMRNLYEGIGNGPIPSAGLEAAIVKYDVLLYSGSIIKSSDEFMEILATDGENNKQYGYQQVKPWFFENEEELLDYIENSVTELTVLGFSDREALRKALFEEKAEIIVSGGKTIQAPRYKTVNGKLCLFESDAPRVYTGMPVVVEGEKYMEYYATVTGAYEGILKIEMVRQEDGTWRAHDFHILSFDGEDM